MFNENKTCATCSYYTPQTNVCMLTKREVTTEDYCSFHTSSPLVCEACGRFIISHSFITKYQDRYVEVCGNCARALETCAGCKEAKYCAFEQDPSPLPKIVMKTLRQGNAIMQTQVRNPERVRLLCEKCSCWNTEDKACGRELGYCNQHNSIFNP